MPSLKLIKFITTIALVCTGLPGCASGKPGSTNQAKAAPAPGSTSSTGTPIYAPISKASPESANAIKIERVPFELGVSSVTVERIAKQNSCQSQKGAGLLYKKGPIEVYRVECEDGQEIKARCEMRQCEIFKP
ncbi:hypothetical protein [Undibacterium flavidum]|uniref:Lipoprotein n=1 Tax=Undibacterium flavidum TaxID=2762297 RepID=A0ABR6Y8M0_9BURK|nr:hypothetical protein [Undibacterium flavidum]MBC3872968.1 hypothetical protein [Undibacterium flavidum]